MGQTGSKHHFYSEVQFLKLGNPCKPVVKYLAVSALGADDMRRISGVGESAISIALSPSPGVYLGMYSTWYIMIHILLGFILYNGILGIARVGINRAVQHP